MSKLTLRCNLADSPVTAAMKDGRVTSDIVTLDFCGPKAAHNGFKPMVRENAFDCGELAIVTYFQARTYNKPYILLPIPVSGRTQHHCIGFNKDLGHLDPKDIEGKKVGVRTYAQTTALWVRGVLQNEYGVDMDKVSFLTIDEGHLAEYTDPPNCSVLPKGSDLGQMMLDGEVAASILGIDMPKDPRVQTLIPDPIKAGEEWCKAKHVFPINHMFVVRESLTEERPDVVKEIYRMLKESRELAPENVKAGLPPVGLEANRQTLELALEYAWQQHILPRRISHDELYNDVTRGL